MNGASAGIALLERRREGVLVAEAAVPASAPMRFGRVYVEKGGAITTGIAVSNPSPQDAIVSVYFTDAGGTDFGADAFTLKANSQVAAFLNEAPFNLSSSLEGTLTFTSSLPVGVIAVRGRTTPQNEFLMTALPVAPLGSGTDRGTAVIPYIADGGGWSAEIVLMNTSDAAESGTIQFVGQVAEGQGTSRFSYSIPAH